MALRNIKVGFNDSGCTVCCNLNEIIQGVETQFLTNLLNYWKWKHHIISGSPEWLNMDSLKTLISWVLNKFVQNPREIDQNRIINEPTNQQEVIRVNRYDELVTELEKQKRELIQAQEMLEEAKRISQTLVPKCVNCQYYHPHYVPSIHPSNGMVYFTCIREGHCDYPRLKNRTENDVCRHFEPKAQKITDKYRFFFCTKLTNTL